MKKKCFFVCLWCKKEIGAPPSRIQRNPKYCSLVCKSKYMIKKRKNRLFNCVVCDKKFKHITKRKNIKICSKKCWLINHKRTHTKPLTIPKDVLYQKYVVEKKLLKKIMKELNIDRITFTRHLNHYKIPRRTIKELNQIKWMDEDYRQQMSDNVSSDKNPTKRPEVRAKLSKTKKLQAYKMTGPRNWNWQGGVANLPYPYEFNQNLKSHIRRIYNTTCQLCGQKENGHAHAVHHINFDKDNCTIDNLIPLCSKCNSRVNFNRETWQKLFMADKTTEIKLVAD